MRRKYSFLLTLGVLVFITPFLGVPESWKSVFLFSLGTFIVLSALKYRFASRREDAVSNNDFYIESEPATHPVGEF